MKLEFENEEVKNEFFKLAEEYGVNHINWGSDYVFIDYEKLKQLTNTFKEIKTYFEKEEKA